MSVDVSDNMTMDYSRYNVFIYPPSTKASTTDHCQNQDAGLDGPLVCPSMALLMLCVGAFSWLQNLAHHLQSFNLKKGAGTLNIPFGLPRHVYTRQLLCS